MPDDLARLSHLSPGETILTSAEACSLMRLSYPTLKKMSDQGAITFIKLNDAPRAHRRYVLRDVLAFLKNHTIENHTIENK